MNNTIAASAYNTALQMLIAGGCKNLKYFPPVAKESEVPESKGRLLIAHAEGATAADQDSNIGNRSAHSCGILLHPKAVPAYIQAAAAVMGLKA